VRNISHHHQASIVCLQETKIENLSVTLNFDLTSSDFDYAALPASSTAGGAYTSWRRDLWDVSSVIVRRFSITVQLSSVASSLGPWTLTNVYGPPNRPEKHAFLQELRDISSTCAGPWLVCGDFNLIYRAADKNNGRLHRGLMRAFRETIDDLHLEELDLNGQTAGTFRR
jgi:exonuclease III